MNNHRIPFDKLTRFFVITRAILWIAALWIAYASNLWLTFLMVVVVTYAFIVDGEVKKRMRFKMRSMNEYDNPK